MLKTTVHIRKFHIPIYALTTYIATIIILLASHLYIYVYDELPHTVYTASNLVTPRR